MPYFRSDIGCYYYAVGKDTESDACKYIVCLLSENEITLDLYPLKATYDILLSRANLVYGYNDSINTSRYCLLILLLLFNKCKNMHSKQHTFF